MEKKDKKRTVVLFGAGAVIDFEGPTTCELTELIKDYGFYCRDNETRITKFIWEILSKEGYNETEINFETIINIVEDFIIYYSYANRRKTSSFSKVFLESKFENELLNFSIRDGKEKHGYTIDIPKVSRDFIKNSYSNESPKQFFFQHLLLNLLADISNRISKYTYHTEGHSLVFTEEKEEINKSFQNWVKQKANDSTIRMYTLNYDRLFKILSERVGIEVFEGFDCGEFVSNEDRQPNLKKILLDFDCHTYYNLHGSVFWKIKTRENGFEIDPKVTLKSYPILQINNPDLPMLEMEKGKNILMSNIVTGYHKTQKSYISPFRQMQSTFDRDCVLANEIYVIGYSFGDAHINTSIKNALMYNEKVVLNFVDPSLSNIIDVDSNKNNIERILIDILKKDCLTMVRSRKVIRDDYHEYFNGRIKVNIQTTKEFLARYKD